MKTTIPCNECEDRTECANNRHRTCNHLKPKKLNKPAQIREEVKNQIKLIQNEIDLAFDCGAKVEGLRKGLASLILISSKL